jgi:hypothetical protein
LAKNLIIKALEEIQPNEDSEYGENSKAIAWVEKNANAC